MPTPGKSLSCSIWSISAFPNSRPNSTVSCPRPRGSPSWCQKYSNRLVPSFRRNRSWPNAIPSSIIPTTAADFQFRCVKTGGSARSIAPSPGMAAKSLRGSGKHSCSFFSVLRNALSAPIAICWSRKLRVVRAGTGWPGARTRFDLPGVLPGIRKPRLTASSWLAANT